MVNYADAPVCDITKIFYFEKRWVVWYFIGHGEKFKTKKDGIAAGDTFNGAFAVALVEGNSCAEAIAFAHKAASISVTRAGAQSSVPYRKEIR